jgi:hypothetical protein
MNENNGKIVRLSVSFNSEDNALLIKLQAAIQARLNERVTIAYIVRNALRELAKVENINS